MEIFGELERFAADLYPYRWPITIAMVIVAAAALAVAYRLRWHETLWRHRLATAVVVVPLLVVAIPVGYYTLSPLWQRSFLEEQSPLVSMAGASDMTPAAATPQAPASDADGATGGDAPAAFEPRITHAGMVVGADDFHFGRGDAQIIEVEPGRYVLRFENFSVRNGPDLFVYLSPDPDGFADGAINLGDLKATDGAFNYDIPEGTDISEFRSAVVWCRQFAVLFATATLEEV